MPGYQVGADGKVKNSGVVMNAAERARIAENRGMGHGAIIDKELADAGHSQQYRDSLDKLSQARLQEGLGQANRQMAAQSVARGSSPLAQRMAVMQGGANAMQATNASAQFAQQADMAGAQMAQGAQQMRLNTLMQQEAFEQQERDRYAQLAIAKMQKPGGGSSVGDVLGGMGTAAAGAAMLFSDVTNKEGIVPMGGQGGYQAPTYQSPVVQTTSAEAPSIEQQGQGVGGIFSGLGQMFGSDEHSKTIIASLSRENDAMRQAMEREAPRAEMGGREDIYAEMDRTPLDEAMRATPPYAYQYKPDAAAAQGQPTNTRAGIMAQDAERHPLTAAMVRDTPQGKAIDMPTAMGTNMAMTSRLAERMDRLEQQRDPNFMGPPDLDAELREAGRDARARIQKRENPSYGHWDGDAIVTSDGESTFSPDYNLAQYGMRPLSMEEQLELNRRRGGG